MRTTLSTIYSNVNSNINKLTSDMERLNTQISSGSRLSKISDDPVSLVSALRFRSNIVELDQYTENITMGETIITGSENVLTEMKDLIIRAKELTVQAINPALSASEHTAIAEEIKNIKEQAIMLANNQVNGKYIFAGQRTTGYSEEEPAPFVLNQGGGHWLNGSTPSTPLTIPADTLKVNGIMIGASADDGISSIDADASAAAKQAAINAATNGSAGQPGTGVTAEIIPANVQGGASVQAGSINANELLINGIDITTLSGNLTLTGVDQDNVLVDAINAASGSTGVKATRNTSGQIMLTAVDGRNIEVQDNTAANITGLTNSVTYGSIKLSSSREFTLEDTSLPAEDAFAALGIKGGSAVTGEADDVADDGQIQVVSIHDQTGSVRYNGDFENDLKIKIGRIESLVVGINGQEAIADTSIFTTLQQLEDALRSNNFSQVTGKMKASDTTALLDSGMTGLENENIPGFATGSFAITISDHDYDPPTARTMYINLNPATDTLQGVASRIDGVPDISASWNSDGKLVITSDNPDRYTFVFDHDTSNFLLNTGVDKASMQAHALNESLGNLDSVMDSITEHVSSFGAKANRISVQAQIYSGLKIAAQENLSAVQDTDMIKAIMELKSKELAYEATLAAAAKTMQLSLIDFL